MDATQGDRLWSALDAASHRDSVSSSSSISSNDTVIDLSLPNLASRSPRPPPCPVTSSPLRGPYSTALPAGHRDTPRPVSKSKSNPNLRQDMTADELDELRPRPLSKEPRPSPPPALMQRRHTWSRLYMEGLKQAAATARSSSSTPQRKVPPTPPTRQTDLESAAAKSKSLGDLTSDDIACHFDSKYRSISRSFLCRPPPRDQRRFGGGAGGLSSSKPRDAFTEQLKLLTDVEPLTSNDFSPCPTSASTLPRPRQEASEAGADEWEQPPPLRRMSSRSQSRVRYIANRAKQAQERQRLQGMLGRPMAGSVVGGPLEERGNPEGACTVAQSACSSLDLLSQLPPAPLPQNHQDQHGYRNHENQNQAQLGPQDSGVFFRLKL